MSQDMTVVDAALKELELSCSLGLCAPDVPLEEHNAVIIHNAAVKLGEACNYSFVDYTPPIRLHLVEKLQVGEMMV